jgi:hypothetical protein
MCILEDMDAATNTALIAGTYARAHAQVPWLSHSPLVNLREALSSYAALKDPEQRFGPAFHNQILPLVGEEPF